MRAHPERDVLRLPAPPPARTGRYGPEAHQVYDVYPTAAGRSGGAWVVLVHGGFWRAEWDRVHLRPLAAALARLGHNVALLEFARSGMPTGGWPGTFTDVAAGLAAVRRSEVGAGAPVVLAGHSAGGHLAVWLLHQPEAVGVAGAVSLAGCLDLGLVADLDLDGGAVADLMGAGPQALPEPYRLADPARLGRTAYPVVALHGTEDDRVPLEVSRSWMRQAGTEGRDRLTVLHGAGHFALIDPGTWVFPVVAAGIRAVQVGGG